MGQDRTTLPIVHSIVISAAGNFVEQHLLKDFTRNTKPRDLGKELADARSQFVHNFWASYDDLKAVEAQLIDDNRTRLDRFLANCIHPNYNQKRYDEKFLDFARADSYVLKNELISGYDRSQDPKVKSALIDLVIRLISQSSKLCQKIFAGDESLLVTDLVKRLKLNSDNSDIFVKSLKELADAESLSAVDEKFKKVLLELYVPANKRESFKKLRDDLLEIQDELVNELIDAHLEDNSESPTVCYDRLERIAWFIFDFHRLSRSVLDKKDLDIFCENLIDKPKESDGDAEDASAVLVAEDQWEIPRHRPYLPDLVVSAISELVEFVKNPNNAITKDMVVAELRNILEEPFSKTYSGRRAAALGVLRCLYGPPFETTLAAIIRENKDQELIQKSFEFIKDTELLTNVIVDSFSDGDGVLALALALGRASHSTCHDAMKEALTKVLNQERDWVPILKGLATVEIIGLENEFPLSFQPGLSHFLHSLIENHNLGAENILTLNVVKALADPKAAAPFEQLLTQDEYPKVVSWITQLMDIASKPNA